MPEPSFEAARALVEDTIRKLGIDPKAAVVPPARGAPDPDLCSYTFKRGSAMLVVTLSRSKGATGERSFLRVAAPVLTIDEAVESKRLELYERLLTLNSQGLYNAAFGLMQPSSGRDRVVVVSERPAAGLDAEEVEQMIRHLGAVADTYDDRLAQEFGGTLPKPAKSTSP